MYQLACDDLKLHAKSVQKSILDLLNVCFDKALELTRISSDSLMSDQKPNDWKFLPSTQSLLNKEAMKPWQPHDTETIISSSRGSYLHTLPLICGDTSFVRCQSSSQSSTGEDALCTAPMTVALHHNSFNDMATLRSSSDSECNVIEQSTATVL